MGGGHVTLLYTAPDSSEVLSLRHSQRDTSKLDLTKRKWLKIISRTRIHCVGGTFGGAGSVPPGEEKTEGNGRPASRT